MLQNEKSLAKYQRVSEMIKQKSDSLCKSQLNIYYDQLVFWYKIYSTITTPHSETEALSFVNNWTVTEVVSQLPIPFSR